VADLDLRRLERAAAGGDPEAWARLNIVRVRAGLKALKRKIIHYVPADKQDRINRVGKIMKAPGPAHHHQNQRIISPCAVELYPRGGNTYRKTCYYTVRAAAVTCKSCLRVLNSKNPKTRPFVAHFSRQSADGAVALCGRGFDKLTTERNETGCTACVRIFTRRRKNNARGRRRARRVSLTGLAL